MTRSSVLDLPSPVRQLYDRACHMLDAERDTREPHDPASLGDGGRTFARDLPHHYATPIAVQRLWAAPLYRMVFDPDGRPCRDRFRGRL